MLGIRLFQGWGFILTMIIFLILVSSIKLTINRIIFPVFLGVAAAAFQFLKGSSISYCILVAFYIIDACFMVYYTEHKDVRKDFVASLKIYLIQAFVSIIVFIIVPKSLMWKPNIIGVQEYTFLYVFYYFSETILGIPRLSGWAWEPGCMQMLINLFICFQVYDGAKIKDLIIPSILLFFTGSTAGYAIYAMIICVYLLRSGVKNFLSYIPIMLVMAAFVLPFMWENISNKLSIGEDSGINPSGAMRVRDFLTGIEEVKQYPLFGIDVSDLSNSPVYQKLEDTGLSKMNNIDSTWRTYFDYAAGGYNNGFFCMHMLWGVLGILFLVGFIKCRLWNCWCPGRYHLMIPGIILLTMVSSPLSNTALFLYFCMFNFVSNGKKQKDIYSNSNIQCRENS